jgi:predicted RNA-binding protein with PUA domain
MSQPKAADDFSAIAARLRELEKERETTSWCERCNLIYPPGHGRRCPGCGETFQTKKLTGSLW